MSSACTGFDLHGGSRQGQFMCKKTHQFFIGCAVDRWCRHSNLERITVNTNTDCLGSFRLDMDSQDCPVLGLLNKCWLYG